MTTSIFDFEKHIDISSWRIIDDVVMGGMSNGEFFVNQDGNGVFKGEVSLENNGGFSSVRHQFKAKDIRKYSKISIRLKGDGKRYQFRVKRNANDYHSYISYINTSTKWETIEIDLSKMYPSFRGRKLRMANFSGDTIEEIAFLFGNKKEETFQLEIDKIALR
jgi:hypothetical protein